MDDLAEIKRHTQAARTFVHQRGPASFTVRMPPIVEAGETIARVLRAEPGKQAREESLGLLLDLVVGWSGVTLGLFTAGTETDPVEYSREACEQLFLERPDVMGDISGAVLRWLVARAEFFEAERKNFASTSLQ